MPSMLVWASNSVFPLLPVTIGDWAQDRWDFAPWGMFGGVLLGFASGLRRLIKIAEAESKTSSKSSSNSEK